MFSFIGPAANHIGHALSRSSAGFRFDQQGQTIDENDNWGGTSRLVSAFAQTGAFSIAAGSKDAALLVSLPPGVYTAQVSGVANTTGVALIEVYEVR
ncbi:MAG: hypothetical protein HZA31_03425 [Opitutae bacterium]|nr:hypothetical protein [Opitutae bacterium]